MSQSGRRLILIAALCGATSCAAMAPVGNACPYLPLDPGSGKVSIGTLRLDFGQADDPAKATAWQGPIAISRPDAAGCSVDPAVGIIERPIFQDGRHLLVTTYSGSNRVVFAVDTATCAVLWHSRPFIGPVRLNAGRLTMGNAAVRLGADCIP